MSNQPLTPPKDASQLLDLYYHDLRHHLLEAAACLDRLQRAENTTPDDKRLQRLLSVLPILADDQPDKARRFLETLSV